MTDDRAVWVYVDLEGRPILAGRLWARVRRGRESATFEYADSWRERADRFALDPALTVGPGPHHTPAGKALFAALGDSAPDRWGRTLIARRERARARAERRVPRTLYEIDYLLGVSDRTRQGALRFTVEEGGPFPAEDTKGSVPPLVELPRLLAASERFLQDGETEEDLRLLLAPGSSLGGARPKASVQDTDGSLLMAKFPATGDPYDVVRWEAVALWLAKDAGIPTPDWRLEEVAGKSVLLLKRFDREGECRLPFLSAMSMLGANDGETHSYMEIADVLRQHGALPKEDIPAVWRRMVLNILVSNTDDHLRNHAFLYVGKAGWRLSPAYDINPVPLDLKPRVLSTAIGYDDDTTASLERAFEVAEYFEVAGSEAKAIAREIGGVVERWSRVAAGFGLSRPEIERLESAFEHEDLRLALRGS